MMRLSHLEQLLQEEQERLEACGLASPGRTEFDDLHDEDLARRDRLFDHGDGSA